MNFKHEILLNSFNRPIMIKEALKSIYDQRDVDPKKILIRILDDNSQKIVKDEILRILDDSPFPYKFTSSEVIDENRYKDARYAICINEALELSLKENDDPRNVIIHYFTDDSIMYPYKLRRHDLFHFCGSQIVYNNTVRTQCKIINNYVVRQTVQGLIRRPPHVSDGQEFEALGSGPHCNFIDHISLSHRLSIVSLIDKPYWDTNHEAWHAGDWLFWKKLANLKIEFVNINEMLDEKQWHDGCLQWISEHEKGLRDGSVARSLLRE